MPLDVAVARFLVVTLPAAKLTRPNFLWIRRPNVQVGGANLNIPADGIHDQWQHARLIDQVQKDVVIRQQIANLKVVARAEALSLANPPRHLVDRGEQSIELRGREKVLDE